MTNLYPLFKLLRILVIIIALNSGTKVPMKRILSGPINIVSEIIERVNVFLAWNPTFFALDPGRDIIDAPLFVEKLIWCLRQTRYET